MNILYIEFIWTKDLNNIFGAALSTYLTDLIFELFNRDV